MNELEWELAGAEAGILPRGLSVRLQCLKVPAIKPESPHQVGRADGVYSDNFSVQASA